MAVAESRRTPEQVAIHAVQMAMQFFAKQHDGQMPTNWSQVETEIDLNKLNQQTLIKSLAYPLQEHYVFVSDKIPMLGYQEGNVILIRTGPVDQADGDIVRQGRYIISTNESGFYSTWVSETNVQKMLAQAGITNLPEPELFIPPSNVREPVPMNNQTDKVLPVIFPQKPVEPQIAETPSLSPVESTNPPAATPSAPPPSSKWPLIILVVAVFGLSFAFFRKKRR